MNHSPFVAGPCGQRWTVVVGEEEEEEEGGTGDERKLITWHKPARSVADSSVFQMQRRSVGWLGGRGWWC